MEDKKPVLNWARKLQQVDWHALPWTLQFGALAVLLGGRKPLTDLEMADVVGCVGAHISRWRSGVRAPHMFFESAPYLMEIAAGMGEAERQLPRPELVAYVRGRLIELSPRRKKRHEKKRGIE